MRIQKTISKLQPKVRQQGRFGTIHYIKVVIHRLLVFYVFQWLNICFKDKDVIADLRRSLSESEKRNKEINREFQKLLRQKEVMIDKCLHLACIVTC